MPVAMISDLHLPGLSGVECVARLAPQLPETQVIMITVYDDSDSIFDSLAASIPFRPIVNMG